MIKKLLLLLSLVAAGTSVCAQTNKFMAVVHSSGAPVGGCINNTTNIDDTNAQVYFCIANAWVKTTINLASPPPIGNTTPNTGAFSTVTTTGGDVFLNSEPSCLFGGSSNSLDEFQDANNTPYWITGGALGTCQQFLLYTPLPLGTNPTDQQVVAWSAANSAWTVQTQNGLPTGVAAGSNLVSNGVGVKGVYQTKPTIDVRDYGVKCDGSTNDSTAMNNAFAAAVAIGSSTGGTAFVRLPSGICIGNFSIVQGKGLRVEGAGELTTHLRSPNSSPALTINGLWYSQFSDMTFDTQVHTTVGAVLEIDGNWDGTHTQGIQFLTFTNVQVAGTGSNDGLQSQYVVALCRQGGSSCQGSNVQFINSELHGAGGSGTAVYYQNGFNALANQFIGGDFQGYGGDGAQIAFGSAAFYGTTFESTEQCIQLTNGGFDIHASQGGVYTAIGVYDVRTESYSFYGGASSQPIDAHGVTQNPSFSAWVANTAYSVGTGVNKTDTNGKHHLYCVTTGGTTGGSQPTWPISGTVTDGSVVWTTTAYDVIQTSGGYVDYASSMFDPTASVDTMMALPGTNNGGIWTLGTVFPLTGGNNGGAQFFGDNTRSEFGISTVGNMIDCFTSSSSGASRLILPSGETLASIPSGTVGCIDMNGNGWSFGDNNFNHLSWWFHDVPCASGNCDEPSFFAGSSQSTNPIFQVCPSFASSSTCANPFFKVDNTNGASVTGGAAFGASASQNGSACETSFGITTLATGATTTDTGQNCLPANAIIDAVVYRITTTITTAASFTIGDATIGTRFCGTQSTLTAGTTGVCFAQADQTGTSGPRQTSAAKVRVTTNVNPGAGAIRLITYYHTWTPPTS